MLNVDISGGVARVTLNRPEVRNAFDDSLIAALTKAFIELENDSAVRAMVLLGNGPAFCAGADLNWMKRMAGYGYEENLADAQALATMLATLDRVFKQLDWDVEADLAPWIGGIAAHRLNTISRDALAGIARALSALGHNASEYLVEEVELMARGGRYRAMFELQERILRDVLGGA